MRYFKCFAVSQLRSLGSCSIPRPLRRCQSQFSQTISYHSFDLRIRPTLSDGFQNLLTRIESTTWLHSTLSSTRNPPLHFISLSSWNRSIPKKSLAVSKYISASRPRRESSEFYRSTADNAAKLRSKSRGAGLSSDR